jgi:uncharacterized protein (DUF2267 family)
MSLRPYQWPRLLVLTPGTSVLEAARALENNQVGAVLVQRDGRLVGIVTDRDLAIRVLARGLDPAETTLGEVMTSNLVTLPSDGSRAEAIRLMRLRGIRRIPILSEGRITGLVTLDDFVADESVPLVDLAEVIRAQIGDGGTAAPSRFDDEMERRRDSRLEASKRRLLMELRSEARLESLEQAEAVFAVVVSALVRRLTPDEADDLMAQLPRRLVESLRTLPPGPDKSITPARIEGDLMDVLGVTRERAAGLVEAVARSLDRN